MMYAIGLGLLLFPACAMSQPGDLSEPYLVKLLLDEPLYKDTTLRFEVRDPRGLVLDRHFIQRATRDSVLLFTLPRGATPGLWQVNDQWTGRVMQLELQPDESPLHTTITLPFTQGAYNANIHRLWKCFTDQAPELGNIEPWPVRTDTLACGGGRVIWSRANGNSEIIFFDLLPFTLRMELGLPTASCEASYPGGMENFHRFIRTHFNKALIERVNVRAELSARVVIETDGSIHQVQWNGGNHPELNKEFKRVLQLSSWWQPAVVENIRNTNDPRTFRTIEQSVVIDYAVDPDSIWTEIPDESMTILPQHPTSRDSIRITLHWIGGSCGRYKSEATVMAAQKGQAHRMIDLQFGALPSEMCCDLKAQSWTQVLPPLASGTYWIRRSEFPDLRHGPFGPETYAVKVIEVK